MTQNNNGWIKLHRSLLNWEWYDDIPAKTLFLHLLLTVNFESNLWHGVTIERGSTITGRFELAKQTGLTPQQVRTALTKLKSTSNLTIKSTNKFTIISICNFEKYQDQSTSKITSNPPNEQPTNNQQITTLKEEEEYKNEKKKEETPTRKCSYAEDSQEYILSKLLLDNIRTLNGRFKNPDLQKWSAEIDKMIRLDHRTVAEIKTLILWVSQDNFWRGNILSTSKLREKFDQLWTKACSQQQKQVSYSIIS